MKHCEQVLHVCEQVWTELMCFYVALINCVEERHPSQISVNLFVITVKVVVEQKLFLFDYDLLDLFLNHLRVLEIVPKRI